MIQRENMQTFLELRKGSPISERNSESSFKTVYIESLKQTFKKKKLPKANF